MREKIKKIIKGSEYEPYTNEILQRLLLYGDWANMQNAPIDGHIAGGKVDIFSLLHYLNHNQAKADVIEKPKKVAKQPTEKRSEDK